MVDEPPNFLSQQVSTGTVSSILFSTLTVRTFERLPSDNPAYSLVGQVASDWAYLEHILDLIIGELAGIDQPTCACITAQMMGHSPRCDTIIALATHRGMSKAIIEKVDALKNSMFQLSTIRNRIIHDPWIKIKEASETGVHENPGQYKSMARKELKYGADKVQIDHIDKTLEQIKSKRLQILKLMGNIRSELNALRGK